MCDFIYKLLHHIVMNSSDLRSVDLRAYAALLELGSNAYRADIAHRLQIPEWKVSECIARLESKGVIRVSRQRIQPGDRRTKNRYFFRDERGSMLEIPDIGRGEQNQALPPPEMAPNGQNEAGEGDLSKLEFPDIGKSLPSTYLPTLDTNTDHDINSRGGTEGWQQTTMIEHQNAEALGGLDIEAQRRAALDNLTILRIKHNIKQRKFPTAPELVRLYTPAEILFFHDPDGKIAANLAKWRAAWDAGHDVTNSGLWQPQLIWAKIVELQPPPDGAGGEPPALPADLESGGVDGGNGAITYADMGHYRQQAKIAYDKWATRMTTQGKWTPAECDRLRPRLRQAVEREAQMIFVPDDPHLPLPWKLVKSVVEREMEQLSPTRG